MALATPLSTIVNAEAEPRSSPGSRGPCVATAMRMVTMLLSQPDYAVAKRT